MRPRQLGFLLRMGVVVLALALWPRLSQAASCQQDSDCPDRVVCVEGACQTPRRSVSALIYYHKPGPDGHRVVLPFYFSFWRPGIHTQVVFPLFWRRQETGDQPFSDLAIPPLLYQRRQEPGLDSHRVWPLFFYTRYTTPGAEGRTLGLLPLFFAQHRGARTLVVLPLLLSLHVQQPGRSLGVYLLLGFQRQEAWGTDAGVVPLFFWSRRQHSTTWAVPPLLLGHSANPEDQSATTVAGPLYVAKRGTTWYGGVVPVLFVRKDPDSVRVTMPPLFHLTSSREQTLVMATPLVWHWRDATRSFSLALPLFYQARGPERSDVGVVPLFFFSRRQKATTWALPPLLLGHTSDPENHSATTVAGPVYVAKRGASWYGGVVPLFFFARRPHATTWALPPLLLGHTSDPENQSATTVAGPVYVAKRGATWYGGLCPLLFIRKDADSLRLTMPPLFHLSRRGDQTLLMVTPLIWHWQDATLSLSLGLPLFYQAHGPEYRYVGIVPLFFFKQRQTVTTWAVPPLLLGHSSDPENHSATTVAGPVYVAKRGDTFYGGLVPFLFLRKSPDSLRVTIPPLFHLSRRPEQTLLMATPLVWHWQDATRHFSLGLPLFYDACGLDRRDVGMVPLFFFSARQRVTTWAVPLLLLGHSSDPEDHSATTIAGPVYVAKRGDTFYGGLVPFLFVRKNPDSLRVTIPPLFHLSRRPEQTLLMATPLVWHWQDATRRVSLGLPLFYDARGPDRRDVGVVPLFFFSRRQRVTTWAVPLLLLGHTSDPADHSATTVAGPVYVAKRGDTFYGGLVPFLFVRKNPDSLRVTIPPLFHLSRRPEQTLLMATPLVWHWQDATRSFSLGLPLFYQARGPQHSDVGVVPLFFFSRRQKITTWAVPLLLLGHTSDPENQSATTVAGPVYVAERGDTWYGGVVPLFFFSRRPPGSTWAVPLLLLGHTSDPEDHSATTVAGPVYVAKRGETWCGGLVPLLFIRKSPDSLRVTIPPLFHLSSSREQTLLMVTPLVWHWRDATRSFSLALPLFYHARGPERRDVGVVPLFFFAQRQQATTWAVPLLLLGHTSDPENQSATTVAGPLYVAKRGTTWYGGLAPLFFFAQRPRGTTWAVPLLLLGHGADPENESATTVAGPIYVAKRGTTWYGGFLPLLFIRKNPESLRVTVPPLFHLSVSREQTLVMATPLIWHSVSAHSSTTVAFPLFYRVRRPDYRAIVLLPLFVFHEDAEARTLVLPPLLTFARFRPDGSRTIVSFPLVFHSSAADRSSTVVLPFIYHLRRPSYQATVFFPLGAHWQTARGHYTLVLNSFYFRGAGASQGTWSFRLWPLFGVGRRPRPQDLEWSILEGLVGYQRLGRYRTLRLFWIPIHLKDAPPGPPAPMVSPPS